MHVYTNVGALAEMRLTFRDSQAPWSLQQLARTSLESLITSSSHGLALKGMYTYTTTPPALAPRPHHLFPDQPLSYPYPSTFPCLFWFKPP